MATKTVDKEKKGKAQKLNKGKADTPVSEQGNISVLDINKIADEARERLSTYGGIGTSSEYIKTNIELDRNGHKKEKKHKKLVMIRTHINHNIATEFTPIDEMELVNTRLRRMQGKPVLLLHKVNGSVKPLAVKPLPADVNITPDELFIMQDWHERTRWQRKKPTRWQKIKTMAMIGLFGIMLLGIFLIGATVFSD